MPYDIGKTLKKYRNEAKISVKHISDILTKKGFKASESTIYSWENGNSQPTPGALLIMCDAYGIKDILSAFGYDGYNDDGTLMLNMYEVDLVEKYRKLDSYGQDLIQCVMDKEYSRCTDSPASPAAGKAPTRIINYYYRLASAGTGQILFDTPPTEKIELPDIPEYRKVDYAIGVNGNSMEPAYQDGDKLLVEMTTDISVGEIGIFLIDNECFVKELGNKELISLNKDYKNIPMNDTVKCMGKVVDKLN